MAESAYILFMFGSVILFMSTFERWAEISNLLIRMGCVSFFSGTLTL